MHARGVVRDINTESGEQEEGTEHTYGTETKPPVPDRVAHTMNVALMACCSQRSHLSSAFQTYAAVAISMAAPTTA